MATDTAKNAPANVRPPVVVVLGHVDHGKTKLLDAIRETNVVAGESGGITQHIGAYQATANGRLITFLDTPGHEAFSAIRSRGATVADVAILVVAADESVKPQTEEAIRIIRESETPYIVAISKMDKDGANPAKVRQDLASAEVLVEGWGGDVPVTEISAKTGAGIPELLDMVLLVADLNDLTADPAKSATGVIVESHMDKRRGFIATALVQDGTLHVGDYIVVGSVTGKVRSMEDFNGGTLTEALPSQPALVLGWTSAPDLGRPFRATDIKKVADEWAADSVASAPPFEHFRSSLRAEHPADTKVLNVIFKADVTSSLEALELSVKDIAGENVAYRVVEFGVGNVTEQDIKAATAKGAVIFGFRVGIEPSAAKMAEREGIRIVTHDVIYEVIESFREELSGLLAPELKRNVLGKLRILALFKKEGTKQILGGKVTGGKAVRGCLADVVRDGKTVRLGKVVQLQHNKEDVTEVREGLEAGLRIDITQAQTEAKEGDVLELYEEEKVRQNL
ncbi:MAG TPA: translation initiation factor IF-2 [Candidatus Paceibacterota bacterium]|nr:translation initiation factor IF-2 [Candidatus Paceibacterota bacterium]